MEKWVFLSISGLQIFFILMIVYRDKFVIDKNYRVFRKDIQFLEKQKNMYKDMLLSDENNHVCGFLIHAEGTRVIKAYELKKFLDNSL